MIYGTRVSFTIALISVGIATAAGIPLGLLAGYRGGRIDLFVSRVLDAMFAFPVILLAIAILAITGVGLRGAIVAIGLVAIPEFARVSRSAIIAEKENDYVLAAHSIGASGLRIVFRNILPNTLGPLIVLISLGFAFAILNETALSFLGLGAQPPTASWGADLAAGRRYLREAIWLTVFPGLAIFLLVLGLNLAGGVGITLAGLAFMAIVGAINLRGVGESLKMNVLLTCVELTGLLIIIFIGLGAIAAGQGDVSRVLEFKTEGGTGWFWPVIAATTLAFFAMVGFEDSVNMAEEAREPTRIFPKVLLAGLIITGLIYVLVSIAAITLVPPDNLAEGEAPLLKVVEAGAPNFPVGIFAFITMFAVANTALINMLMASRLLYGMGREGVLPLAFGRVHAGRRTPYVAIAFTTLLAFALITFVGAIPALGGTTALLLLCVFVVVNVAVLTLRSDRVAHEHFRTPTLLPILGAVSCAFLAGPWTGRDPVQYKIAGILMAIGIGLWLVMRLVGGVRPLASSSEGDR